MTTGIVRDQTLDKHIQKQMGCMAGFLHIFDRHQILAGKHIYSAKRLPPSAPSIEDSSPESEKSSVSPAESTPSHETVKQSPLRDAQSPTQAKTPLPLPVFEFKEGTRTSWKFSRDAPRLSLDSRAVVDAKGGLQPREIRTNTTMRSTNRCENHGEGEGEEIDGDKRRRSTSVIARLMGLETLPDSDPDPVKKAELRRSASESRVSRDLPRYRFFDSNNFQLKQLQHQANSHGNFSCNVVHENAAAGEAAIENRLSNGRTTDTTEFSVRNGKTEPLKLRGIGQRKSFYDSADFFPEPKHTVSIYGEIERRLKMRGIDEPSKDLETLKHILEALQLKGLLHSKKPTVPTNQRNFVLEGSISGNESPIVVMKPARSSGSLNRPRRTGIDSPNSILRSSPLARRSLSLANETLPAASRKCERPEINRNIRTRAKARNSNSPTSSVKSPNRRKLPNTEAQRKVNDGVDRRRVSSVHSPKVSSRRNAPDQQMTSGSPRMRKSTALIDQKEKVLGWGEDESCTISESSFSTSSQTDTERYKLEEYKEGRNLLERCDKLLNSIAEITAGSEAELQPSPVSVLDPSFYRDEGYSPSPVMKRCIDYKDQMAESEDEICIAALCSNEAKSDGVLEDCDFVYVSEILRACSYLLEDSDIFLLLERQQYLKGKDTSKASTLQRRLIFDTIHEILGRNQQLPPWKAVSWAEQTQRIWSEFRRIREREESEDLFEVICGVLRKDMAEEVNRWGEWPVEMGDQVLDIERLIFKDLIGESIRDLASFAATAKCNKVSALRRKLVF